MKRFHNFLVAAAILVVAASNATAYDPSPLQDFCVATNETQINGKLLFVNGKFCKNPKLAKADDFFASGLNIPGNTRNRLGISAIVADVNKIPGLNTQGLSLVRLDFAPLGENPPHTHPRATEILALAEGTLYVGFLSSGEDGNRLFAKLLKAGDVFVFPFGVPHFHFNPNRTAPAVAFSALTSQSGGMISIAKSSFGSKPAINPDVLAKAFHLDRKTVELLQQKNA